MRPQSRILLVAFFSIFLDLLGWGIIIPVQPFYAETLGASPALITFLGSSFALMQFLFAPLLGRLSDRIGRKPVMLTSIVASFLGHLVFALSSSLPMLFAARMLAGIGAANIGTAQAIVADTTSPEKRAKGMGLIGVAFGLGFTLGPAIGGFFVKWGLSAPAFVAAALSFCNLFLAYFWLPETNPNEARVSSPGHRVHAGLSWRALSHAARHRNVAALFLLYLFYPTAFSMMEQTLGLFVERTWAPGDFTRAATLTAYCLMVVGVTAIIVQGGLIGALVKRFGEGRTLRVGTFLISVALFLMPLCAGGPFQWLLVACVLNAFGTGMTNPSLGSLLSQSVDADEQGGVLGLGQGLAALGRILGPSMAGFFFQQSSGAPFWVGSFVVFGCFLMTFRLPARASPRSGIPIPAAVH